ncbi:MAG: alpha-glucosidase [Leptospirales bacterium]|nr:alpha-glucosidase [Leptospirales bacterium]
MNDRENFVWWKHGVIYHIYLRSFCDANGDGIGDIPGLISKLDYLHTLGIDALWLSPIYKSPLKDTGYDVSDYREIDPVYGNIEDFKKLIKLAHMRKIHVILDMPLNHTSDQHPWFLEASSSKDNPKHDWYIWHDGKGDKKKYPNNWRSAFGGRAWTWNENLKQYYLHLFLPEQPDLNWRNPKVQKAMLAEMKYWLDLGVDGFRLDVANYIIKDEKLRNNPYLNLKGYPRVHDFQLHKYDRNQNESHGIYKELRAFADEYGAMLVGEIYPNEGRNEPEVSASYLGAGDELNLAFDFSPIYAKFSSDSFLKSLIYWYRSVPSEGWPCHVFSNHDKSRAFNRLAKGSSQRAKLLAALLLTQRGTPFIYYGEEIGLANGKITKQGVKDPAGKNLWPFYKGRDPFRCPMQWDRSVYAGFSEKRPWLPVNENSREVNVYMQDDHPSSILSFYRRLINLRRKESAFHAGDWMPVEAGRDILAYYRGDESSQFFVALNFSGSKRRCQVKEASQFEIEMSTDHPIGARISLREFDMHPYGVLIAKKIN